MKVLKSRWDHMLEGIVCDDLREKWWSEIVTSYSAPHRYYHNLFHLAEMFHYFDNFQVQLEKPLIISLAIFFHDLVYDPKSSTNEEDSVQRFDAFAKEAELNKTARTLVASYIQATKSHSLENLEDSDLGFFLDFDLAVLGRSPAGYLEYAKDIRREFTHVPPATYRSERSKILSTFLGCEHIFVTSCMRNDLEANARKNLSDEIELLRYSPHQLSKFKLLKVGIWLAIGTILSGIIYSRLKKSANS